MTKQRAQCVANITAIVQTQLLHAQQPISSRRIAANAKLQADQQPHISKALNLLVKRKLVQVEFGRDPDFPRTDRLYAVIDKNALRQPG